jgi:hypothetical protein
VLSASVKADPDPAGPLPQQAHRAEPSAHQATRSADVGFESFASACAILDGIELVAMKRKRQARYAFKPNPSLAEQLETLAA